MLTSIPLWVPILVVVLVALMLVGTDVIDAVRRRRRSDGTDEP